MSNKGLGLIRESDRDYKGLNRLNEGSDKQKREWDKLDRVRETIRE